MFFYDGWPDTSTPKLEENQVIFGLPVDFAKPITTKIIIIIIPMHKYLLVSKSH